MTVGPPAFGLLYRQSVSKPNGAWSPTEVQRKCRRCFAARGAPLGQFGGTQYRPGTAKERLRCLAGFRGATVCHATKQGWLGVVGATARQATARPATRNKIRCPGAMSHDLPLRIPTRQVLRGHHRPHRHDNQPLHMYARSVSASE